MPLVLLSSALPTTSKLSIYLSDIYRCSAYVSVFGSERIKGQAVLYFKLCPGCV